MPHFSILDLRADARSASESRTVTGRELGENKGTSLIHQLRDLHIHRA